MNIADMMVLYSLLARKGPGKENVVVNLVSRKALLTEILSILAPINY